jgi:hypothetical protein
MAIKKNISAKQTTTSKSSSVPDDLEQEFALLDKLMSHGSSEVNADLARIAKEGLVEQARMICMIGGLKYSEAYQLAVKRYNPIVGECALLKLCGQMYMAGKTSATRYDPASLTP